MKASRKLIAILLLIALAGCGKSDAVSYATEAVSALQDVRGIFVANGLPVANIDKAIEIGQAAVSGLQSGSGSQLDQVAAFITAFEVVAGDANLIPNPTIRTAVLVGLLVANVALHHLSDVIQSEAAKAPAIAGVARGRHATAADTIAEFQRKPVWRCRNASTGRFEKLEFCKKNPANSVVERY